MKRTAALPTLGLALAFALCGCAASEAAAPGAGSEASAAAVSVSAVAEPASAPAEAPGEEAEQTTALVICFSATGNTEALAREIAAQTGADFFALEPEQPYTAADLDYNNADCRANLEQNDEAARPAFVGGIEGWERYDTVYLGFPIWWGTLPRIVNTLLDTYDFTGKTVLPFCTSGGSGIAQAEQALRTAAPDAQVKPGLRLSGSQAQNCADAVAAWLKESL